MRSAQPDGGAVTPVIEVDSLNVTLGSTPILHDVSLRIDPGEMVALLGANGSGKSTLLRTIVGIIPSRAGTVRLFGAPVARASAHDRIGYVPQFAPEAGSIPATAREVVATGLLRPRRWLARGRDPRITALLSDVGLADLADRPVTQMSGGQRQRVMIARALVRRPDVLILDEPFSGVDLATQETLARMLERLRDRGTTVLVILHHLGSLEGTISRAIVLDQGRIVHDGPPHLSPAHDEGHDHTDDHAAAIDACLGQELHP